MTRGKDSGHTVIFDVCDTLYNVNTTAEFIRFYHALHDGREHGRSTLHWTDRRSTFFYLGAIAQRLGWDIARQRIIASLAGASRQQLEKAAKQFVSEVLPSVANNQLHDRLKTHQLRGDAIILLSSSLDVVIAEIAERFDADFRASTLQFDDQVCTGKLSTDLTGRKAALLADVAAPGSKIWVYTDNRSDKDLIALADRATIILPRGAPDSQWAGDECEYVRL